MNLEVLRDFCLSFQGTTEDTPFGEDTLVFRVKEKIFLLTSIGNENLSFNVKCDPAYAVELREKYPFVKPGYHMNKKHWNTVNIDGPVSDILLKSWITHSYELVRKSLPARVKSELY